MKILFVEHVSFDTKKTKVWLTKVLQVALAGYVFYRV